MGRLARNLILVALSLVAHLAALALAGVWLSPDPVRPGEAAFNDDPLILSWIDQVASESMPEFTSPEPLEPVEPMTEPDDFRLGERDGSGDALSSNDAPNEHRAQQAEVDQALVRVEPEPALPEEPAVEPAQPETESRSPAIEMRPDMRGVDAPTGQDDAPLTGVDGAGEQISNRDDAFEQMAVEANERSTETPATEPAATVARVTRPDPGAVSYTDSDPFSTKFAAEFQPGGTSARGGRAFSVRRPRVDLGFRADATRLGTPIGCTFRITIDTAGRPKVVEVIRSSGSERIDQATRLALFDAWFDPADGPRTFNFAIVYRCLSHCPCFPY